MIRYAAAEDAGRIADIYLASRKRHVPFAPLAHDDENVRVWIRETLIPQAGVYVMEDDEGLCAFIAIASRNDGGWIEQLYVHPDKTGLGCGSALLAMALKLLPRPVRLFTFQENHGARRFYERAGFRAVKFSDGSGNEERCPDVLYEQATPV